MLRYWFFKVLASNYLSFMCDRDYSTGSLRATTGSRPNTLKMHTTISDLHHIIVYIVPTNVAKDIEGLLEH